MSVVISDDILDAIHMSAEELKREIAVLLFQQEKLTLGQASQMAGMNQLQFQFLLASRQIPLHYGIADFDADLESLREKGRL